MVHVPSPGAALASGPQSLVLLVESAGCPFVVLPFKSSRLGRIETLLLSRSFPPGTRDFEMEKPFSCHSDVHSKSGLSMAEQKLETHLNISPAVLCLSNQGQQR